MMAVASMMAAINSNVHAQHTPVGITSSIDSVKSVQIGILSSVAVSQMKGFQFGGFANMSAAPINGLQLSGVSNIAMGVKKGVQLAPMFNISGGDMRGLQTSLYNFSDTLSGVQVGLFNRAILNGNRVVFCDDSIVRGTQLRDNVRMFFDYGAKEPKERVCTHCFDGSSYQE